MRKLIFGFLLLISLSASAVDIRLQWDASPSQNVGGYKIYIGSSSSTYGAPIKVGNITDYVVTGLNPNTQYFIAATAYDTTETIESAFSNEVSATTGAEQVTTDVGEITVLPLPDAGNGGLLMAQKVAVATPGYLQSFSFYVVNPAGTLRYAIYDSTGANGNPGNKLGESDTFTAVTGWNTALVKVPVLLQSGNYWIAYNPSSNDLSFVHDGTGQFVYQTYDSALPNLPMAFATTVAGGVDHWSFYITLSDYEPLLAPINLRVMQ